MKHLTLLIALILVVTTGSNGQNIQSLKTAGDLVVMCGDVDTSRATREPVLALNYGFCMGHFNGLVTTNFLISQLKGTALFCPPAGVTPDQARKIFLKYMTDHPEKLHEDSGSMAIVSLTQAFPCTKTPN